jgi:hypothetical protein
VLLIGKIQNAELEWLPPSANFMIRSPQIFKLAATSKQIPLARKKSPTFYVPSARVHSGEGG